MPSKLDTYNVLILYASIHHQNTKKTVRRIAGHLNATVISVLDEPVLDIALYGLVIFASGIYCNHAHKKLIEWIKHLPLKEKKTMFLYTCGLRYLNYEKEVKQLLIERKSDYVGSVYCRGYDTYGLLRYVGGIAKGHPNEKNMHKMINKIDRLLLASTNDR